MKKASDSDHGAPRPTSPRLRLLGGFALHGADSGTPLPPPPKKSRALLAYLALTADRPSTREKLAALLWPESGEEQARASLRQALSGLRRLLDDAAGELLITDGGEVRLDAGALGVDVLQVEALAKSGALPDLARAAALCGGPLLDGLDARAEPLEQWLTTERARVSAMLASTFSRLLAVQEQDGDLDAALRTGARLVACAPLREDAHRAMMRLHERRGHWNDALEQYASCERLLREELGVPPQAETIALRDRILAQRDGGAAGSPDAALVADAAPAQAQAQAQARRLPFAPARDEGKPTILVLPFESLTPGDEHEAFADGMTEDITVELSRFPELFVIARNTAFAYKGRTATAREVGAELQVQYLVSGTIRRAGARVRVTAQLVETGEGRHLWAQRYDRELADVFELQDELARSIVGVLPGRVRDAEARRVARQRPEDMAAYELLLAGKIHHHRFTPEDNRRATELLERALEIDPGYAPAWAWKACVLGQAVGRGYTDEPAQQWDMAIECARRSLSLDDNEVECQRVMAEVSIDAGDLKAAERHNARALELNPNDPKVVAQRGELQLWRGHAAEATESILAAMRLDPYGAADFGHLLGRARLQADDHAGAVDAYRACSFMRHAHRADLAGCLAALGEAEQAAQEVQRTLAIDPEFSRERYLAGLPYDRDEDRARHARLLELAQLP